MRSPGWAKGSQRQANDPRGRNKIQAPKLKSHTLLIGAAWWLCTASAAWAWNPTGHMVIASMTYDQLSPETRSRWAALLRQHPDFAKWEAAAPKGQPDFDEGRYLFMRASTWPDDIRKTGNPFDHPVWHYVDYPLIAPDFPEEPAPTGTEDVLFGIARCETVLVDAKTPDGDRAAYLSWLIHLVGDLQQPLHCAALVTPEYPGPGGDRGGNLFYVSVGGAPINLHWFWDCLPGTTLDSQELLEKGRQLSSKFPRGALPELETARDPKAWSLEGRALCLEAVYRNGALVGARQAGPDDPGLPAGYLAAAHAVAERRLAVAADRLADILRALK